MRFIFLIVGIWNTIGALNFIVFPKFMASQYGYQMGNMWESAFIGGIAIVFALIYFSFFKKEPPKDMLYLVYLFAFGKFWVFISNVYCVIYYKMPVSFAIVLGGGDLIMGMLFVIYIIMAKKKYA
ncbi:MAG: hypothetical protein KA369_13795 [Spirochaetes bacterium]|nr:hypothetical protein [Spirochaetota bacterium]